MNFLARTFVDFIRRTPQLRRGAVVCLALALVASAAEVAVAVCMLPVLSSLGIDAGVEFESWVSGVQPVTWLILFALVAGLRAFVSWQSAVQQVRSSQDVVVALQSRLFRAMANAHWDAVRHLSPPVITSALQNQTYEVGYGFSSMVSTMAAALLVAAYLVSAAFVFPLVLPLLLLTLIVMWWINRGNSAQVSMQSENYVDAQTELHERYEDWVAISRIASLGVDSGKLARQFESGARDAASLAVGYSRASASTQATYDLALVVGLFLGVVIAWYLDTPPALLVFGLLAFVRVLPRARSIQTGYQGIVNAVPPLRAVESLAETLEADPVVHTAHRTKRTWQQITLEGIGVEELLGDKRRRWTLRDVNLQFCRGEWLAFAGPTGAGKSTLAEVLLMLVRPDAGSISIDDRPVDVSISNAWRCQSAYVPQDVVLFDASIRDNLKLYAADASDAELGDALLKAAADFVFERLPEGLDTRAGPGGRWLSGGERQRIGIARALLSKPGFLVLDEPTAALDGDTQARLMQALGRLDHDMSVIIVSHRPELLELVDRVVQIQDGRIVVPTADVSPKTDEPRRHR